MAQDERDVFISYAREDEKRAKQLRTLLRLQGRSVFLDEELTPGPSWHKEIQRKLEAARCVVALWSQHSVNSNVQFDEANFALSRGELVIARLDDADLPLGLRPVQHIDLTDWESGEDHQGIARLLGRIDQLVAAANARPRSIGEIPRVLSGKPDSADRHSVSNRSGQPPSGGPTQMLV